MRFSPRTPTQLTTYAFAAGTLPSNLRLSPSGAQPCYTLGAAEYRMQTSAVSLRAPAMWRRFYGFGLAP